jgi:hypothetical protein
MMQVLSSLDSSPENGIFVFTHVGKIYDKLLDFGANRSLDYFELSQEEEYGGKEEGIGDEESNGKHAAKELTNDGEVPSMVAEMAFMLQFGVGLNQCKTVLVQLVTECLVRTTS